MVTLIHLSCDALGNAATVTILSTLAAEHQLVLVCAECTPQKPVLHRLRYALPGRRLVAVLVTGEVARLDRQLIKQLLDEGVTPVIMTVDDVVSARLVNWSWLGADRMIALPSDPPPT
jgi:acetylglutamate kinase